MKKKTYNDYDKYQKKTHVTWFASSGKRLKEADEMANGVDQDQTAPAGAV